MNDKRKRKILVVDDDINVSKSIRKVISEEEYEVETALSGEEALQMDRKKKFDLIITDLMMPGLNGLELLETLKQARPGVNVIMITGYPTIKTAVQSVKMGAFDYLPKPFTPAELRSLVTRVFKKVGSDEQGEASIAEPVIPPGYYYMLGHAWLKVENEKEVLIGIVHDFLKTVGMIVGLELPPEGSLVAQGEVCGKITDADELSHRIWSPASGRVLALNGRLKEDYSLMRKNPYGEGWLFRIEPTELREDLVGLLLAK
jgi:CheY-like chemotaxis protein